MNALAIPAFVLAYLALVWWWEKRRPPFELTLRRAGGLLYGLAWGVGLQLLCVGVLWVAGAYRVQGFDWSYNIVPALLSAGIGAAVNEEIMFRGILYRLVEDTFGTWVAIALSGLTFGLAHLTNAHASLQGALAIALEAGVLFAALYALTRSLWLVIGFHFAWNMVQGPVLGIVLSGSSSEGTGYLRSTLEGPAWLAGGGFGMEASLVTVVILTALAACLLVVLRRRGLVVRDDEGRVPDAATDRSRFSANKDTSFVPVRPERVVEVAFDQMEGHRFRHAVTFLRWRPDRDPQSCLLEQVDRAAAYDLGEVLTTG